MAHATMCFPDPSKGAQAQQDKLDQREEQRQSDVNTGKKYIDSAYSQYGPGYYDDYQKDYTDYYDPQLDTQYEKTGAKMQAALAGRGMGQSTVSADANADLLKQYNEQKTGIANEAADASQKLKSNVENSKSDMYALNESSADPAQANTMAMGQAAALAAPPTLTPLAQVFSAFLQPYLNYQQSSQNAVPQQYKSSLPTSGNPGYGSGAPGSVH